MLVHCGKWWPSKTLPIEWWQEIVDELSKTYTVGLIGKTIDEKQGYLPVVCPDDGIAAQRDGQGSARQAASGRGCGAQIDH